MKTVAEFLEAFLPQATPEQTSEMTEAMSMRVGLSFKNGYIHLLDVFKSNIQKEEFKRQQHERKVITSIMDRSRIEQPSAYSTIMSQSAHSVMQTANQAQPISNKKQRQLEILNRTKMLLLTKLRGVGVSESFGNASQNL